MWAWATSNLHSFPSHHAYQMWLRTCGEERFVSIGTVGSVARGQLWDSSGHFAIPIPSDSRDQGQIPDTSLSPNLLFSDREVIAGLHVAEMGECVLTECSEEIQTFHSHCLTRFTEARQLLISCICFFTTWRLAGWFFE